MSAILFGSISTLADTSELQRRAFNEAFTAHGLAWEWSREDYQDMLASSGGKGRIADYASARDEKVDAAAVHATKSQVFQDLLGSTPLQPRPGVVETLREAGANDVKVAFVTTTSAANVAALMDALKPEVDADAFDLVVDSDSVDTPKPEPAVYEYALEQLQVDAADAVAIEDNVGGLAAAAAAGVKCIAFPNENTRDGDFGGAAATVDALDPADVIRLATA